MSITPGGSRLALAGTRLSLGIKAGANLFKVDGESFSQEFQFGYMAALSRRSMSTGKWGIQPELNFNQTNYRTGNNFSAVVPDGVNDVKGKLDWLTIPVLLSYRPIPILSSAGGSAVRHPAQPGRAPVNNAGERL